MSKKDKIKHKGIKRRSIEITKILAIVLISIGYTSYIDYRNEKSGERWEQHRSTLINDLDKMMNISEECENATKSDIDGCIGDIKARVGIYELHLKEAKNFLNDNGKSFSNEAELREWLDDQFAFAYSIKYQLEQITNSYEIQREVLFEISQSYS